MNISTRPRAGGKIDLQALAKLWNIDGLTASQYAERIGISRNAVVGHVHRHKDIFESRRKEPSYLRTRGRKTTAKPHSKPITNSSDGRRINMRNIHKARIDAAMREAEEFEAGTSPLLKIHVSDEERLATGKEVLELGPNECKFPLNNGGLFIFCAQATGDDRSCCWHHINRAYRPKGSE